MNKIITGWLLLKDLPGAKAGDLASRVYSSGAYWGKDLFFSHNFLYANPTFFLPIYDYEEVCPKCKGIVDSYYCSTCKGQRKISKVPAKPPWPPVKGQVVWFIDGDSYIHNTTCIKFHDDVLVAKRGCFFIADMFATKEQAEEYLAWSKEKGLAL